ncbi:phosphodiesterase [Bordetella genomosp. 9]|uniref:phosphodiesterase n=1 Tax=Bordetella genomosp. 9 TaxID=1416803 RepID=UPI001E435C88|nr:phosphodiesterase [Bordetella genomosp. 9]
MQILPQQPYKPSALAGRDTAPLDEDAHPALLIQLTDPHLFAEPGVMLGVDTEASLRAVVDAIRRQHGDAELLLATGDLSHDGTDHSYQRFADIVRPLGMAVRCLPGNHDSVAALRRNLGPWTQPVTDVGAWRVILLDSRADASNAGHLERAQFDLLDDALAGANGRPALVAMHHNAVQVSADWRDPMMLDNAAELFRHLARWRNAKLLLWGHVHQEFDRRRGSMRMLATPSTCFQFAIRDGRHRLDPQPPGYRWLKLYPDGSVATGVRRLEPALWQGMLAEWAQPEESRIV